MPKKLKKIILTFSALLTVISLAIPTAVSAQCSENGSCGAGDTSGIQSSTPCPSGQAHPLGSSDCIPVKQAIGCPSGKVDVNDPTKCVPLGNDCNGTTGVNTEKCLKETPLIKDLNNIVDFLSAAVGVVVIAVIIIGGIQYSMAGGNANATEEAKKRITNALIALVAFMFAFAFLQWLIPGGI